MLSLCTKKEKPNQNQISYVCKNRFLLPTLLVKQIALFFRKRSKTHVEKTASNFHSKSKFLVDEASSFKRKMLHVKTNERSLGLMLGFVLS